MSCQLHQGEMSAPGLERVEGCALCDCVASSLQAYPIAETRSTVAFLNPRQRTEGSVLIVPRRHVSPITALSEEEMFDGFRLARDVGIALARTFSPDGLHSWCRLSDETPQHFVHHHFQLVPRYRGQPYSYAKSWELDLTSDQVLARIAERIRMSADVGGPASYDYPKGACGVCADLQRSSDETVLISTPHCVASASAPVDSTRAVVISARRHVPSLLDVTQAELEDLARVTGQVAEMISASRGSAGISISWEAGEVAGQAEPHLTIHLVPRSRQVTSAPPPR